MSSGANRWWAVALIVCAAWSIGFEYGADHQWWPEIPSYLGRLSTSLVAALIVVNVIVRKVKAIGDYLAERTGQVAEAYRTGLSHGRREQIRRCGEICGHRCGHDYGTGAWPAVAVGHDGPAPGGIAPVVPLHAVRSTVEQ